MTDTFNRCKVFVDRSNKEMNDTVEAGLARDLARIERGDLTDEERVNFEALERGDRG